MLASYATGLVAIVLLTVAWIGVQSAWRRVFSQPGSDPDVLAGRMSCHDCGCTEVCDRRREVQGAIGPVEEGIP